MTKEAALHNLFSSFGLTAYQEDAAPTGDNAPSYPYLTYEVSTGSWGDVIPLSVSLWYRSTSWVAANAMAQHISDAIGLGGIYLRCDNGAIIVHRGDPFARSMGDESDNLIKRKVLNIMAEYLTED